MMTDSETDLELLMQLDDLCELYERELRLGQEPKISSYLERVVEAKRPALLGALVTLDVSLRADKYKRMLVDQILQAYTTELMNGQSVETLRSIIQRAIDSQTKVGANDVSIRTGEESSGQDFSLDVEATQSYEPRATNANSSHPTIEGYRIDGTLGQGGMGVVYKATQLALNRTVALKMILRSDEISEEQLRRFEREAKAIAELKDPRFVQIHQFGYHQRQPFMALEFVEGGSLETFRRNEPQSEQFATQMVQAIAEAMSQAHAIGLVHRDLKPHNILLTRDLQPKVADFGLVKRQSDDDSQQTEAGRIMGTACYMSPEQSFGESNVSPATDIHALGGILYCLLTGRPPYLGKTRHDTIQQLRDEEPVAPSRLRAGLSKDLETICLKCLEKDPRKRYASASEVALECQRFLTGHPINARPISSLERGWRWSKRNPLGATVGLLVMAIASVSSVMSWRLNTLNHKANEELARRTVAELKRDEADAKRAVAEEAQNVVLDKSMQGFHDVLYAADKRLRNNMSLLPFRKQLLLRARDHIDGIPITPMDNPLRYRDSAIANQRLGEIAMLSDGVATALGYYDSAYDGLQKAATLSPSEATSLKNLGTICELQAQAHRKLGQTFAAREKASEALENARKWEALQPNSGEKDLNAVKAVVEYQIVLGDLALSLGEVPEAGKLFSEARKAIDQLSKEKRDDKKLEFWILTQHGSLALWFGEYHRRSNQNEPAEEAYDQAIDHFKLLTEKFPKSVGEALALAQAHKAAGDFQMAHRNEYQSAANQYRDAHTIIGGLYKENQDDLRVLREAGNINYRFGALIQIAENHNVQLSNIPENASAKEFIRKSVNARLVETKADPDDMQAKIAVAMALARYGNREQAAKIADEMIAKGNSNPRLLFQACCTYAQCSHSPDETEQSMYRARALQTLDPLRLAGWRDLVTLRSDPDLIPLQGLDEYRRSLDTWNSTAP